MKYSFRFLPGHKEILPGSTFSISTNPAIVGATIGPCTRTPPGDIILVNGATTLTQGFKTPEFIDCEITVPVAAASSYKSQAKVPAFSVTATITDVDASSVTGSKEYFMPTIQTFDVPVYTGGQLGPVSDAVVTSGAGAAGTYISGECVQLRSRLSYWVIGVGAC